MNLVLKRSLKWLVAVYVIGFSGAAYSYDSVTDSQSITRHQSQLNGSALYVISSSGSWNARSVDESRTPWYFKATIVNVDY